MKNLIEARDDNNIKRQKFKKKFDNAVNLSAETGYRLLDEGVVVCGEDTVRFIIAKGALEKYYNGENEYLPNIDDDYTGYINLGHDDFYANPICLLGEWNRNDLSVVDIGGDRKGIDVNVRLYDWHPYTQVIHNLPYTIGLSAEFYGHMDYEKSETIGEIVYDEICITDFAVVGYGANVNSNGISLAKGEDMKKDEIKQLQNALSEMKSASELEEVKVAEEVIEPEKLDEEPVEEEELEEEEPEEEEELEEEEEEEEEVDLSNILTAIRELTKKVEELTTENGQLRTKLEAKDNEIRTFTEKFESLSVGLNPDFKGEKKENVSDDPLYGGYSDGIGGW